MSRAPEGVGELDDRRRAGETESGSDRVNRCGLCPDPDDGRASCIDGACAIARDDNYHLCGTQCASDDDIATCGAPCELWQRRPTAENCDGVACVTKLCAELCSRGGGRNYRRTSLVARMLLIHSRAPPCDRPSRSFSRNHDPLHAAPLICRRAMRLRRLAPEASGRSGTDSASVLT
jgi:hypothetical protein